MCRTCQDRGLDRGDIELSLQFTIENIDNMLREGHRSGVFSVAVSPNGKTLFSSSGDKTVRVWDLTSRSCSAVLEGHTSYVTSVAVSPDGKTLFSSS